MSAFRHLVLNSGLPGPSYYPSFLWAELIGKVPPLLE